MKGKTVILVLVVAVIAVGTMMMLSSTPVEAKGRCLCPQVYAPVTCDNGKTYPNQCEANCKRARNCVPANTF